MFEQDSALAHRACEKVEFLDLETPDFMLSADTMNIFHQRTRLSSPSKQGSNWPHQLKLASLHPWHITSALHHA